MDLSLSVYGQTKIVIPIGCLGYTKYLTQKSINQVIYSLLLANSLWAFTTDYKLCHTLTTMFVWVGTYSTYHMKRGLI